MSAKVTKFEIKQVLDNDFTWMDFVKVLWKLQDEARTIKNRTTDICREISNWEQYYKKENDEYPKKEEMKIRWGYGSADNVAYSILVKNSDTFGNSGNLTTTLGGVCDKIKSVKADLLKGNVCYPSFKKNQPIDLHNNSVKFSNVDNKYIATVSLLSNMGKKEHNRKSAQFDVELIVKDSYNKAIIDRCLNGEYKHGACKIEKHPTKNKWMFALCYKFDVDKQDKVCDNKNVLGVDLGIKYVAYMSVYNPIRDDYEFVKGNYIEGGEINQFRQGIEKRRLSMLKQSKYCGDGRSGHGSNTLLKPIEKLQNKVENFRQTCNHRYSKYIVEVALANNCGKIVMENLSGVGEQSDFLKKWSYYELQNFTKYKAKEVGIEVEFIDPKYTSQRCNKCGCIDKENRETQSQFICKTCGHKDNADRNASRNIAYPNIEQIIKEYS